MVRARLPANPLFSVSGREPRAGNFGIGGPPAGCFEARFAPPSPLTLEVPFRGANSSHKFRADARVRPLFLRRGLLPANPCGTVPGSKFFTHFPRRLPRPAGFFWARFAPRSPLTLVAPFRGANSSHRFRAATRGRPAFPRRGLLPANRKPLQLRSGEQILHTDSAPTPGAAWLFQGAVCSPLLANPCGSVPGSKFFTQFPRRLLPPADFSKARFAPLTPLTLEVPFRGANSSHKFRADARVRPLFLRRGLLPANREPLQFRFGEQILHIDSAPTPGAARRTKKHLVGLSARCFPLSSSSPAGSHGLPRVAFQ